MHSGRTAMKILWRNENKKQREDCSGGPVVGRLPANAGDVGSIPDSGIFHIPQGNKVHAPQLLNPWSRACTPQGEKSPQWEATTMRSPCTTTREWPLLVSTREKPTRGNKGPEQPKQNKQKWWTQSPFTFPALALQLLPTSNWALYYMKCLFEIQPTQASLVKIFILYISSRICFLKPVCIRAKSLQPHSPLRPYGL